MKGLFIQLINNIKKHDITSYAAQCAYFLLLSLFPFVIITIMLLTNLGYDYLDHTIGVFNRLPAEIGQMLKDYFTYSNNFSSVQFSPFIITIIWMSSNAMGALIKAFNVVNNLAVSENRNYFHKRFVAVLVLFIMIIMVVLFVFVSTVLMPVFIKFALRFIMLTFSLFVLYYILPNVKKRYYNTLPGALTASVLSTAITYTFGYFITNFTRYSVIYGSMSSIILLLLLLFLLAFILILGEEINALVSQRRNAKNK